MSIQKKSQRLNRALTLDNNNKNVSNKITATCNGGTDPCEITEGLTLTLNAPTDLEFSNTAKVATFESGYNKEAACEGD